MDLGIVEDRANKLIEKINSSGSPELNQINNDLKEIVNNTTVKANETISPPVPEMNELVFDKCEWNGVYYYVRNGQLWNDKAELVGIFDNNNVIIFDTMNTV